MLLDRPLKHLSITMTAFILSGSVASATANKPRIVIAHRGASGYLPEHTLASAAMAYGLGADYIEPDVVLTREGIPIVLHDIHLETTTNVASRFPQRKRADGRWYAADFTLSEIQSLQVHERIEPKLGHAIFPKRFPADLALFQVPSLEEMIRLVQGLNRSTGRDVGLYPELKSPGFHRQAGHDIGKITLHLLEKYGYHKRDANVFIQSFDPQTLKYLRHELKTPLRLIQLIGENSLGEVAGVDFDTMRSVTGLKEIAEYADGIGPAMNHILTPASQNVKNLIKSTGLTEAAHARGLLVHPYTARADQLPAFVSSWDDLHRALFEIAGVDGVFTDFPDKTSHYIQAVRPTKTR